MNNLAALYQRQERFADAEPLFKRALAIRERSLGSGHPDLGQSLNNLATLYEKFSYSFMREITPGASNLEEVPEVG